MTNCLWCEGSICPREAGGSPKRFCSASCRAACHKAARRCAMRAIETGLLPARMLQDAPEQRKRCDRAIPATTGITCSQPAGIR